MVGKMTKVIIKRHGGFKLSNMKYGSLYTKEKSVNFKIIKSMGKRFLVTEDTENEAVSFKNFDELFQKLKQRDVRCIVAFDRYGKSHATILL
jgi:hypothetical protein